MEGESLMRMCYRIERTMIESAETRR